MDKFELVQTGNLNSTLTMLENVILSQKKLSVWPCEPETLRWLVTALLFLVVIVVFQLILQRVFN